MSIAVVACLAAILVPLAASGAAANPQECQALATQYDGARSGITDLDRNGYVFKAADKGCAELVRRLLAEGGSAVLRRGGGDTALHHAAAAGEVEVARLLLDSGADINQRDLRGATPLSAAAEGNHPAMVTFLLEHHANARVPGRSDVSALSAAAFNGNDAMVAALLASGADPKASDRTGKAAIVYAANRGFTKVVERLMAAGVNVNAAYANQLTVLMWAAGYADDAPETDGLNTVTLLLDRGARLDDRDDRGYTALMTAASLGHDAVVKLLLARGADKSATGKDGKTAADMATTEELRAVLSVK